MEKIKKTEEIYPPPEIITREGLSSLKKAENDLKTEEIFLNVILPAVRNHEVRLEVKTDEKTGQKLATVWMENEMIFSTDDQGEVEVLELTKKGANIDLSHVPKKND